jgi:hypothetical protein
MSKAEVKRTRDQIFVSKKESIALPSGYSRHPKAGWWGTSAIGKKTENGRNNCARELKVIPLPIDNTLQSGCHDFRHVFVLQRQV